MRSEKVKPQKEAELEFVASRYFVIRTVAFIANNIADREEEEWDENFLWDDEENANEPISLKIQKNSIVQNPNYSLRNQIHLMTSHVIPSMASMHAINAAKVAMFSWHPLSAAGPQEEVIQ